GVKGLLFESEVLLYSVNTLASFAMSAAQRVLHNSSEGLQKAENAKIHAIIDARRKHFYHQLFDFKNDKLSALEPIKVRRIESFEKLIQSGDIIIGTGLERIDETVRGKTNLLDKKYITAQSLISIYKLGRKDFMSKIEPEKFTPEYYTSTQVS